MMVSRKSRLLATACILASLIAHAKESEQAKRKLRFEVSTKLVALKHRFSEVKYVAYFRIREDRALQSWWSDRRELPWWDDISEEQRQFMQKLDSDYEYRRHADRYDRGYPLKVGGASKRAGTYRILAVSERDARIMAAGVIELFDRHAQMRRENNLKDLARIRKFIVEGEQTLPKLIAKEEQLKKSVDEKTAAYVAANYGIECDVREHAEKSMKDLSFNLKLVDFDLIGLEAKINSIMQYKASRKGGDQQTLIQLEQMYIAADIERAGAQAKRAAYEAAFEQANELYALIKSRDAATHERSQLAKNLPKYRSNLPHAEELVANPPRYTYPVEVYENKVTIHPVRTD